MIWLSTSIKKRCTIVAVCRTTQQLLQPVRHEESRFLVLDCRTDLNFEQNH